MIDLLIIYIECMKVFLLCFLLIGGYEMKFHLSYYLLSIIPFIHLFIYQMKIFNLNEPASCLKAFKSNNFFGLIIFINILIVKTL